MADNRARYGFRPYRSRSGSGTPSPERRFLASAYGGQPGSANCDVQIGDPMTLVNDGSLAFATAGSAGSISHIVVGVEQYWDGTAMRKGNKVPYASGVYGTNLERRTLIHAMRVEDWIWEIDTDAASTYATLLAAVNANADFSYNASAPNANPRLGVSTINTTHSLQLRIQGISENAENVDFTGNYVKMLVIVNKTAAATQAATTIGGV